jgi:poly(A)-specific ribonuclease
VQAACGFSNMMHVIRDAGKPVVGHNCFFDFVYILTQFVRPYATWPEFQDGLKEFFPAGVYDTKHLCKTLEQGREGLFESNSLGPLYEALHAGNPDSMHMRMLHDAETRTSTR